jgi:hypothetical protein
MPVRNHFRQNPVVGENVNPRSAKTFFLILSDLNNSTLHDTLSETRFRRGLESTIATSDAD